MMFTTYQKNSRPLSKHMKKRHASSQDSKQLDISIKSMTQSNLQQSFKRKNNGLSSSETIHIISANNGVWISGALRSQGGGHAGMRVARKGEIQSVAKPLPNMREAIFYRKIKGTPLYKCLPQFLGIDSFPEENNQIKSDINNNCVDNNMNDNCENNISIKNSIHHQSRISKANIINKLHYSVNDNNNNESKTDATLFHNNEINNNSLSNHLRDVGLTGNTMEIKNNDSSGKRTEKKENVPFLLDNINISIDNNRHEKISLENLLNTHFNKIADTDTNQNNNNINIVNNLKNSTKKFWLLLQDLTVGMTSPCIADLKIGTRTYEVGVPQWKKDRQNKLNEGTTTVSHAVRCIDICIRKEGIIINQWDRRSGRKMSWQDLEKTMHIFLKTDSRVNQFHTELTFLRNNLVDTLKILPNLRLYSASVLVLYDGDKEDSPLLLKLIDFGHGYIDVETEGGDASDSSYDDNALLGIDSLLSISGKHSGI
ncbi:hypothetical protein TRFO_05525 [Tritrichomonas foetus]|uniref:Kinase n=1 Tax=Tritrichomonas foetus TaxID=1144522 RepID=A0A1J4K647_9EUKA|nr:hypothetical protein TRFO_05525 [Tritrichomonas foetus]|eukprot:OHT06352.1 hypothetical protein TRFO_05525 [Tritrichomonas foetus]